VNVVIPVSEVRREAVESTLQEWQDAPGTGFKLSF